MLSQIGIMQELAIAKISHPSSQLRMDLDNLDELAHSIKLHGLLQPIVVRPKNNGYEVIAGNRRLAASKMLKLRKINCHLVELSDKEAYEIALVENVHQKSMNPMEEARAFAKYVESFGWGGVSELASRIGRSQEFVTKRMQLLRLPEKIHAEIIRQRITPSVALEMLPLDNESINELADFIAENPLTKDDVRQIVRASKEVEGSNATNEEDRKGGITHEKELFLLDKALKKCVAVMKSTMVNFDDIIDEVHDEWILKELLMQYRQIMHGDLDTFLKLRKRLQTKMPKEYHGEGALDNYNFDITPAKDTSKNTSRRGCEENSAYSAANQDSLHIWVTKGIWQ